MVEDRRGDREERKKAADQAWEETMTRYQKSIDAKNFRKKGRGSRKTILDEDD
jgi:cation transport regulator ChaB